MMRAAGFWILAALGLGAPLGDRLAAALHDQRFAAVGLGLLISALALAPSDREGRGTLRVLLSTLLGALLIQVVPLPLGDGWDDVLALGTFTGIGALFFSLGIASHFRGGGRAVALYAVIGAPTTLFAAIANALPNGAPAVIAGGLSQILEIVAFAVFIYTLLPTARPKAVRG